MKRKLLKLTKKQRISFIREKLVLEKSIYIKNLADKLQVTERTIRRDIKILIKDGIATPFFGGAKLTQTQVTNNLEVVSIKSIMEKLNYHHTRERLDSPSESQPIDVYILGSFNVDIVSVVSSFPQIGQTVKAKSTNFHAGGKGTNQATAAAKSSKHVHLTIKVGNDEFKQKVFSYLSTTSIATFSIFEDREQPTGNAIIMVSELEENNIISINLGANEAFTHEEIITEFKYISRSKVFLTQMETNFDITKSAIKLAHDSESVVILNPAPYNPKVKELLQLIDIITPNETEASDLSGIFVHDIESAKKAAAVIKSMGVNIVIITLGSNGCLCYDGNTYKHYEPFKALVVDTVGAGDSFNGALAASLSREESIDRAIEYASAFASLAIEKVGASNMPDHEMVLSRINIKNAY